MRDAENFSEIESLFRGMRNQAVEREALATALEREREREIEKKTCRG